MQLSLLLTTLATTLLSTVSAGPIPQPIPAIDADTLTLVRRSLEVRADQSNQAQALAQAHALAQLRQAAQWGYPGRYSSAGAGLDLNVLGLIDLNAGAGRTDYCTYPYC